MNAEQAGMILTLAAALDTRFTTADAEQAKARVVAWADALTDVEPQFAIDFVRRYYRSDQRWPVQPGAVRTAWRHEATRRESLARCAALPPGGPQRGISDATRALLTEGRQVLAQTRAAMDAKPRPRPGQVARPVPDHIFDGGAGHE